MSIFRTSVQMSSEGALSRPTVVPVASRVEPRPRWEIREYTFKRVVDCTLAIIGMLVSAPLWLLIAGAIKIEDGGPIFYRQERWGRHKRPFRVYKFRSMVVDAEARVGAVQAGQNDSRVTRVGRLLRATSLDELPQLVNIWLGQMSWVGPRALPINEKQLNEREDFPDTAIPGFDFRCAVRPGLTGLGQIFAPRDVPRRQKFRYDRLYIERQSAWLDVTLIALSVWISLNLRWEHRGSKVGGRGPRRRRGRDRSGT